MWYSAYHTVEIIEISPKIHYVKSTTYWCTKKYLVLSVVKILHSPNFCQNSVENVKFSLLKKKLSNQLFSNFFSKSILHYFHEKSASVEITEFYCHGFFPKIASK